jgi:hypothetical protein
MPLRSIRASLSHVDNLVYTIHKQFTCMVFLTYLSACVRYIRLGCWRRLLKCIRHSLWERDSVADPNFTWFQVHSSRIWTPLLQYRYRTSRDARSKGKKCWLLLNRAETSGRAVEGLGLGRSLAGIVGCVLSGRGICIGLSFVQWIPTECGA